MRASRAVSRIDSAPGQNRRKISWRGARWCPSRFRTHHLHHTALGLAAKKGASTPWELNPTSTLINDTCERRTRVCTFARCCAVEPHHRDFILGAAGIDTERQTRRSCPSTPGQALCPVAAGPSAAASLSLLPARQHLQRSAHPTRSSLGRAPGRPPPAPRAWPGPAARGSRSGPGQPERQRRLSTGRLACRCTLQGGEEAPVSVRSTLEANVAPLGWRTSKGKPLQRQDRQPIPKLC